MFRKSVLFCLLLSAAIVTNGFAQQATESAKGGQAVQERPSGDMGAILVRGLKKTEGCLGVETCEWQSGKQSIVAWFENKAAATRWYQSSTHQAMMKGNMEGFGGGGEPMQHIKDEETPIMVLASLTFASKPELDGVKLPISQISIELFAPLPGGAFVGGRVSPKGFKVPHMKGYTPDSNKNEGSDK